MKSNVSPVMIAVAVVIVVAIIGYFGYQQMKPAPSLGAGQGSPIPSFIDPVTHKPKGMGPGSGMPVAPKPGAAGAPAAAPAGGGQ
jgi:hypothetical protein